MNLTDFQNIAKAAEHSEPVVAIAVPEAKCFVWDTRGNGSGGVCPTLTGDHQDRVTDYTAISCYPERTGALCANSHPGSYTGQDAYNDMLPVVPSEKPPRKYIVRRLTPLECCRLQGFPDWWEDGVEGSDSARYKMWGNGMALPNMLHVMKGIVSLEAKMDAGVQDENRIRAL